jgi:BlaI family penicillinase repressor
MGGQHNLGDLQYAIMRVLWEEVEATVARVQERLAESEKHERALTTIATMLTKMEKKGVVAHRSEGRIFVYRALVQEDLVRRSMVTELTDRLFQGDYGALVSHLLDEQDIDRAELTRLRALLAAKKTTSTPRKEGRRGK